MTVRWLTRRSVVPLLGGFTAFPLAARAQQAAMPVVGFLRSTPAAPFQNLLVALRQGLGDEGFVEGRNVTIEQRWADNQLDRLPGLAADLVGRHAAVIIGNVVAVEAARDATTTIPIVFVTGEDPVKSGLVATLNRPESNLTGVTFFGGAQLDEKRLELLRDLVPAAKVVGVLGDPNYPGFETELPGVVAAGRVLGRQIVVARAASEGELEPAFATLRQAGAKAIMLSGSPFFTSKRRMLIALAARHAIPAIYDLREYVVDGGLMSYSASFTGAYRQAGVYAGKILKGAKPSELPVLQPTKFELAVNLKTARVLGLEVPPSIQLRADEVIE